MKKQPLEFFNRDSWKVRLTVLVFVRLTSASFVLAVGAILIKVLQ